MLKSQFTVLYLWLQKVRISGSLSNIAEPLPVQNLAHEIQSLLQVIVELVKDDSVKVRSLGYLTRLICLLKFIELLKIFLMFIDNAIYVLRIVFVLLLLLLELSLQVIDLRSL